MKKLCLLLCLALATAAFAQTETTTTTATTTGVTTTAPNTDITSLPAGTAVKIKLETPISTVLNKVGDRFAGRVTESVTMNGKTVIPIGAAVEGRVAQVVEPRRAFGKPTITLYPDFVTMPNGNKATISAVVVDTSDPQSLDVNEEGQIKGEGRDGSDNKELALGTGGGAVVGGLISHSAKGTLIGAAVGAVAATAHWLYKPKSAFIPAGTELVMEISRPMMISAATGK